MSSRGPKLRGASRARRGPYPLGEFPDEIVVEIGRRIVHRLAVGQTNISGDDFGDIFAAAVDGNHLKNPIGVTDVVWGNCSWSVKTVQAPKPFELLNVRLISGRNSPVYSYGITDPLSDVEKTGEAVLGIWNGRVNQSFAEYDDLRVAVLIRSMASLEFVLFESEASRYVPSNYYWELNRRKNLEGFEKSGREHQFTWQPHGAQFTIIKPVPGSARKFRVKRPVEPLEPERVLNLIGFKEDWIERV